MTEIRNYLLRPPSRKKFRKEFFQGLNRMARVDFNRYHVDHNHGALNHSTSLQLNMARCTCPKKN